MCRCGGVGLVLKRRSGIRWEECFRLFVATVYYYFVFLRVLQARY